MKSQQVIFSEGQYSDPIDGSLDSDRTICLVFFDSQLQVASLLSELKKALPHSHLIGCSGSGEISGFRIYDQKAVITICRFDKAYVRSYSRFLSGDEESYEVGKSLARELDHKALANVFVLSAGTQVNGSNLKSGLCDHLPVNTVVSGGLAGDGTRFQQTFVCHDEKVSDRLVTVLAFYGQSLKVSSRAIGGWSAFGPERRVTKAISNVLYELDGAPALDIYKEFLGKNASGLPATALHFPLLLGSDSSKARGAVRTILGIDEEDKSLTFAGDIPEGELVRFMRSTNSQLIKAAHDCAVWCSSQMRAQGEILSLIVSCVGRRIVLGLETEAEIEEISKILPKRVVQTGFYSYGEIAPGLNMQCDLHNQSMTLTLIEED